MSEEKLGATFTGQIYSITTKKDGGGKIQIEFGADGLHDIQWAQKVASIRGCNFQVALVPTPHGAVMDEEEFTPDANGEITF